MKECLSQFVWFVVVCELSIVMQFLSRKNFMGEEGKGCGGDVIFLIFMFYVILRYKRTLFLKCGSVFCGTSLVAFRISA